ncbi:hypothetical protein ACROYT_G016272 [Oculina patagonica]
MSSSTLIEVFGHIVFSFTRGVTEHYNPEEPEYTAESFGYDPLQSTGREWYYHPVDEFIYQEYSEREVTSKNYLAQSSLDVRVINACSPDENVNKKTQENQQDEDKETAWKRLRPSALQTVFKSMVIGAIISLLTASIIAVMFRVLQADLDSLESIALLGIIHGFAEVIERSTVVVIDHICHQICRRASSPWGSFRTPRRERLTADIAIMSMLFESTAVVSVNGFLYLYQWIFLENDSLLNLLQSFAIYTSVPLVIEWFFTSVSLAIETRYQNMAVMAVWRRQWKRHVLVAIVNVFPVAIWTSGNLLLIVHDRFNEPINQPCKMPFT